MADDSTTASDGGQGNDPATAGGTHQAFGVVTNAQDFMRLVHLELRARIG